MQHSRRMKPQKVLVAGDQNASVLVCKGELLFVGRPQEPPALRCRYVDPASSKTITDGRVDVLIQVIANEHQLSLVMKWAGSEPCLELAYELIVLTNLSVDGFSVVEVVRQCGMNVPQCQLRKRCHDVVR